MLSEKQQQDIRLRVREIEAKCHGEILVVLASRVTPRGGSEHVSGLFFLLICAIFVDDLTQKALNFFFEGQRSNLWWQGSFVVGILLIAYLMGFLTGRLKVTQFFLIPSHIKDALVYLASMNYFLAHSVSRTPSKSGILVFVSEFEREVVLLVDEAIRGVVNQSRLDEIVNRSVPYFHRRDWYSGILIILQEVEDLLEKYFRKPEHKQNEIHEELIVLPSHFFARK